MGLKDDAQTVYKGIHNPKEAEHAIRQVKIS